MISEEELVWWENYLPNCVGRDDEKQFVSTIRELQEQLDFKTAQNKGNEKASDIVLGQFQAENERLREELKNSNIVRKARFNYIQTLNIEEVKDKYYCLGELSVAKEALNAK